MQDVLDQFRGGRGSLAGPGEQGVKIVFLLAILSAALIVGLHSL